MNINEIYDYVMSFKMLNLKNSKNDKSLKDFIKLNKVKIYNTKSNQSFAEYIIFQSSLKDVTKIEDELKVVLDKISTEKLSKKPEIKRPHAVRDRRTSILCISNELRRNNYDTNLQINHRVHGEQTRQLGSLTNKNIILDLQKHEILMNRLECDNTDMVESFTSQPNIDQNTRYYE